jgi:surface antigen
LRSPAYQSALLPSLYRAWGRVGLLAIRPFGTMVTLFLIGASSGGCSFSRGDGGFFSSKAEDTEVVTGSVVAGPEPMPTESDLTFARTAASDVLTKGDKDTSQPWANPETGARGSVTPLAQAYADNEGRTCRDFLASYVNGRAESWLQGAACRGGHGRWEIHTLKPWKRG